jgi:RNA polymerase sigma-70 factor (ECF subfamily)
VVRTPVDLTDSPGGDAGVIRQSWTEPERFAAIFDRYFAEMHRHLTRRIGPKVADDLAAEVFLAAFAQRRRYDLRRDCARPWLYGIASNLIGSHRRQERRFYRALARSPAGEVWLGDEDQVADRVSAAAARSALAVAVAALTAGDRDVLLLVALADLSYPEVAEALGIPYGTVCSRLNRARKQIREALGGVNPARSPEDAKEYGHG